MWSLSEVISFMEDRNLPRVALEATEWGPGFPHPDEALLMSEGHLVILTREFCEKPEPKPEKQSEWCIEREKLRLEIPYRISLPLDYDSELSLRIDKYQSLGLHSSEWDATTFAYAVKIGRLVR